MIIILILIIISLTIILYNCNNNNNCFVSCGFLVHCYQTSLMTTLVSDNTRICIRMLKGSYIVMKCRDKKYKRGFDIYPVSWLGAKLINDFTLVL